LALDSLLQAGRSGDLTDEHGQPINAAFVTEWVSTKLEVPTWTIVREVLGFESEGDEPEPKPELAADSPAPGSGTALALLRRLRIASLDRVVREATRLDPLATRVSVIAELERGSDAVRWFGRTIVGVRVP
jgi:hypothetical protein